MQKFVSLFKEFHSITSKGGSEGDGKIMPVGGAVVLDANIAAQIVSSQAMQNFDPTVQV